jgi:hypothetical protein
VVRWSGLPRFSVVTNSSTPTLSRGDMKRIEGREAEPDGHVVGVSYESIGIVRPMGHRLKKAV